MTLIVTAEFNFLLTTYENIIMKWAALNNLILSLFVTHIASFRIVLTCFWQCHGHIFATCVYKQTWLWFKIIGCNYWWSSTVPNGSFHALASANRVLAWTNARVQAIIRILLTLSIIHEIGCQTVGLRISGAYARGDNGGCHNTPSATSNTPSPPQPRSNLVEYPLQNTENDCPQRLSDSFRVHRICFRLGLHRRPRWGRFERSNRPLAV